MSNQPQPRIWHNQVIALCQEIMNTLSTLRFADQEGKVICSKLEREAMISELENVGKCAYTLAEDFKKGGDK